ncbi:short chain dehydrogenase [seawater metagenome]|uniref:Short chain dehydrogenase n=1 Tax=seawater metagenome TaxID=1561972 RepID=A0A5E8CMB8_9ZZZZ
MTNKVAIITGASRGIGRAIALGLGKNNYNIVVASKSITDSEKLPGTIHSVAQEIKELGSDALAVQTDVRKEGQIEELVEKTMDKFGRIDAVINNAGALWWRNIKDTPISKYSLINDVNSKASYHLAQLCIPHMEKNDEGGHIIMQSPPLTIGKNLAFDTSMFAGKTAYMISKLGMTMTALGIAEEYKGKNIAANSLWPMTPIESYALKNYNLGKPEHWRKPDILVDCVLNILKQDPNKFSGNQLIDEEFLKYLGETDFSKYQCVPGSEPPKMADIQDMWKS